MYYSIWKHNECRAVVFGTRDGVETYARERFGAHFITIEESDEETAIAFNRD